VTDRPDSSWTRALMASSGISLGHTEAPAHATPEQLAASDTGTPLARLQKLAVAGDDSVRATIARRPDCPLGLLASLAHDRRSDVRVAVAGNRRLTDAIARHLAGDRDVRVLQALARNAKVTPDIVERLAHHRKSDVRRVASRQIDARWGESQAAPPAHQEVPEDRLPWELRDRVPAMPPATLRPAPESTVPLREPGQTIPRATVFNPFVT